MESLTIPGSRFVATTIDEQARSRPDAAFYSTPKDDNDLSQGFTDVTCKRFANAINHAAAWLQKNMKATPETASFEVITYQGPNDLRYPILAVAASKVGKQILFPFPLAPAPVKLHLLHSTKCKYLLHPAADQDKAQSLLTDSPHIQSIAVPELTTWLDDNVGEAPPFPFQKSWEDGKDDPWLIFHTSGTTGLPKPITYTQRMMTSFNIAQNLPNPHQEEAETQLGRLAHKRCYTIAPMSHFSGLCGALQSPIFLFSTIVQGPSTKPPSAQVITETLLYGKAKAFIALPAILREMARSPPALKILKNLDSVQWVGAALDHSTGNTLSQHNIKLCPAIGTTECGPYFLRANEDPSDWMYYNFQPGQGIHFTQKPEAHNLYELVFMKSPDTAWQQIFLVYPDIDVYETKDLFRKHPTKDGLWAYVGRADDVVVLANGANVNAAAVEEKIMASLHVQMALVGGAGRGKLFVVVEITSGDGTKDEDTRDAALDKIWPVIEDVNRSILSEYTRLDKDFIILTTSDRGLVRNPKGAVMRQQSLKKFEEDVERLFADDDAGS